MDRIIGATVDIGSGRRGFRDRDLTLNLAGTIPGATWFNGAQEEIVRAIETLGLSPSNANREQLIQAMRRLAGGNARTVTVSTTLTPDDAGLVVVSAASGSLTLTLPETFGAGGRPYRLTIIRLDTVFANSVTLLRSGADLVEGQTSWPVRVGDRLTILSDGAGGWWTVGDDADRLIGVRILTTTGVYLPTPGTSKVVAEGVGGGGGGAGSVATGASGTSLGTPGAGGAGGIGRYTSGFAGATVTIGAGGTAGGTGGNGGNGGTTSFGSLMSCPGGTGGVASLANTVLITGGQGNTSVPTGANIRAFAGDGGGVCIVGSAAAGYGGTGGRSMFGPGGNSVSLNQPGAPGIAPGSGGSGTAAFNNGAGIAGAAGAPGIVVIWEYS